MPAPTCISSFTSVICRPWQEVRENSVREKRKSSASPQPRICPSRISPPGITLHSHKKKRLGNPLFRGACSAQRALPKYYPRQRLDARGKAAGWPSRITIPVIARSGPRAMSAPGRNQISWWCTVSWLAGEGPSCGQGWSGTAHGFGGLGRLKTLSEE